MRARQLARDDTGREVDAAADRGVEAVGYGSGTM